MTRVSMEMASLSIKMGFTPGRRAKLIQSCPVFSARAVPFSARNGRPGIDHLSNHKDGSARPVRSSAWLCRSPIGFSHLETLRALGTFQSTGKLATHSEQSKNNRNDEHSDQPSNIQKRDYERRNVRPSLVVQVHAGEASAKHNGVPTKEGTDRPQRNYESTLLRHNVYGVLWSGPHGDDL